MRPNFVYRPPPQYRAPQLYRRRQYEPYTLRWLFDRYTQQYTILSEPGGGWDAQSVPFGQSPAVVTGDILITPLLTDPGGYTVTPTSDGILAADLHGDTSLQVLQDIDIYDVSLRAKYGSADFALNDLAPIAPDPGTVFFLTEDALMTPVDLTGYAVHPHGLPLTVTAVDTPPTGLSVADDLSGTPTTRVITPAFTVRSMDPYGLYVDWDMALVVGKVEVPDMEEDDEAVALDELTAVYLLANRVLVTSLLDAGTVLSQDIPAGTLVDPGTTVQIDVATLGRLRNQFTNERRVRRRA